MHAKIRFYAISIASFIVIALTASYAQAGAINLAWEPPQKKEDGTALTNLAGFRIHWGQASGKYKDTKEIKNPKATSTTIANLEAGKTYYFAATAFDTSGNDSDYSNEVSTTIPLLPPPPSDTDGDGLTDEDELNIYKTDPNLADSDGDGFADGTEVSQGSDPDDPASNPTLVEFWVEAEDGELTAPMKVASDADAADGAYIEIPNGEGDKAKGTAQYTFDVSESGTYVIWGRVHAPNGSDDSFFVSIDNGPALLWDTQIDNAWVWDPVSNRDGMDPVLFSLDAGEHTLEIRQREDGTQLDLLLVTNDLVFVPIGTGDDGDPLPPIGDDPVRLPVQSVTASDWQGQNVADNTHDTNPNTRWSADGDGQWIQYDLGGDNLTVSRVAIAWFKGNQRTSAFTIEVSTNGQDWTEVYSGDSSGKTLDLEPYTFDDAPARYLRIVGFGNSSNRWNSITEVEIYGASK